MGNHHGSQCMLFSSARNEIPYPLALTPSPIPIPHLCPTPSPKHPLIYFLSLPILGFHMNSIIYYLVSSVHFKMHRVGAHIRTSLHLMAKSPLHGFTLFCLSICPWWTLGLFLLFGYYECHSEHLCVTCMDLSSFLFGNNFLKFSLNKFSL